MSALDIEERITFESLSPYFPSLRRWSIVTAIVPLTVVIVLWPRNEATLLVVARGAASEHRLHGFALGNCDFCVF